MSRWIDRLLVVLLACMALAMLAFVALIVWVIVTGNVGAL
jgi:hypothetical protein